MSELLERTARWLESIPLLRGVVCATTKRFHRNRAQYPTLLTDVRALFFSFPVIYRVRAQIRQSVVNTLRMTRLGFDVLLPPPSVAPREDIDLTAPVYTSYADAMDILAKLAIRDLTDHYRQSGVLATSDITLARDPLLNINLDTAKALLDKAVSIHTDFAEAHFALGQIMEEQGQTEAALASYLLAARARPHWPHYPYDVPVTAKAFHEAGRLLAQKGYARQAETCQFQALRGRTNMARAHIAYSRLMADRGQLRAAAEHCRAFMGTEIELPAPIQWKSAGAQIGEA